MIRFDRRQSTLFAAASVAAVLAGCSGSGSTSVAPVVQPSASSPATTKSTGTAGKVTLTVTVPARSVAQAAKARSMRKPSYVASTTTDIEIAMQKPNNYGNSSQPTIEPVTPGSGACATPAGQPSSANSYVCTFTVTEPVGTDTFTIGAYDGDPSTSQATLLSQQIVTATVSTGDAAIPVVLDAVPTDFTAFAPAAGGITLTGTCDAQGGTASIGSSATSACVSNFGTESEKDLSLLLDDADGNTIPVGVPGYPTVTVTSSDPTSFTATLSSDASKIALVPLKAGSSIITITEKSASASDGIAATATRSFTAFASEIYVTTGSGIQIFPQPMNAATAIATIGSNATPNLFGIAFDSPNAATGKLYATNNSAGPGGELLEYGAPAFSGPSLNTETFAAPGTITNFTYPNGIAFDKNANLFVSDNGTGDVDAFVAPAYTAESQITGFTAPTKLAFDAAGNLYVPDFTANTITAYAAGFTPPFSTQPTPAKTITLPNGSNPNQVAFDTAGDMFVAESGANQIVKFNAPTGAGNTFANTTTNGSAPSATIATDTQPTGIAFDSMGNLYVAAFTSGTIKEYAQSGYANIGTISGLTKPDGIAIH